MNRTRVSDWLEESPNQVREHWSRPMSKSFQLVQRTRGFDLLEELLKLTQLEKSITSNLRPVQGKEFPILLWRIHESRLKLA